MGEDRIKTKFGVPVTIEVPNAGTTGYQWNLSAGENVRVIDHVITASEERFGASGQESFVVALTEGEEAEIEFSLKAPWEEIAERVYKVMLTTK